MKCNSKIAVAVAFTSAPGLHAQTANSPFAMKANYVDIRNNWQKMAEAMPE